MPRKAWLSQDKPPSLGVSCVFPRYLLSLQGEAGLKAVTSGFPSLPAFSSGFDEVRPLWVACLARPAFSPLRDGLRPSGSEAYGRAEFESPVRFFCPPKRDNLTSPYPQSISSIPGAETGEFAPRITYG